MELPYPPSVNHYLGVNGKRYFVNKKTQDYKWIVRQRRPPIEVITVECGLEILVYVPDKRKRDIDNLLKVLLDSLKSACVFKDDSQVKEIYISHEGQIKDGKVVVGVYV